MRQEIWRHYPLGDKVDLVERLLERGVFDGDPARTITRNRQPGRCCDAPYCMMGVCFDCLVNVDGVGNRQGCLVTAGRR